MTNPNPVDPEAGGPSLPTSGRPVGMATRRGARVSLVAQGFTQLGSVAATMILARLLTPAEFGIIAIAQSILGATNLLSMSGINAALVTRRDSVHVAASSYLWLTLFVGVAMSSLFAVLALPLTTALGQPGAAPYLAVLSLSFALSVLALVPNALLQKSFRFGWFNAALGLGAAVYFVVEIVLALAGWGAWAVIVGQVVGSLVGLVVAAIGARWLPAFTLSWKVLRTDVKVMTGLGAGHLLTYIQKNADYWSVSRVLGGPALGVYYIAYVVPNIVRVRISSVLRQVMLPAYASARSPEHSAQMWATAFPALAGLGLPTLVGVALVAEPLVEVFFGPQWLEAIAPMRILTIATIADLMITSVGTLAIAQRRMRGYVLVPASRAAATVVLALAAVVIWGSLVAVAWAVAVAALVTLVVQEFVLSRTMGVGLTQVIRPLLGYGGLTIVMVPSVVAVLLTVPESQPPALTLAISALVGVVAYFGIGWLVAQSLIRPVLKDLRRVLRGM